MTVFYISYSRMKKTIFICSKWIVPTEKKYGITGSIPDLCEYSFRTDRILLKYDSGKSEKISPLTGAVIH